MATTTPHPDAGEDAVERVARAIAGAVVQIDGFHPWTDDLSQWDEAAFVAHQTMDARILARAAIGAMPDVARLHAENLALREAAGEAVRVMRCVSAHEEVDSDEHGMSITVGLVAQRLADAARLKANPMGEGCSREPLNDGGGDGC